MRSPPARPALAPCEAVRDTFPDPAGRGRVIGSPAPGGLRRSGIDRHRSFAIDDGGLRIVSLTVPGWGTTAIAYGPYRAEPGLALGAVVLNGHNTAQSEPLGESITTRFKRWMKGNETEPWPTHVRRAVLHGRRRWLVRRFVHWLRTDLAARRGRLLELDENFSVGLQASPADDPLGSAHAFVMHATGSHNGELWACAGGRRRPVLASVMNVPLYLLVVVRDDTVMYLAGALEGTRGLPAIPAARPLAIMSRATPPTVHPTVHQAVSGQIGFAADSRVWEVAVGDVGGWDAGVAPEPGPQRQRQWRIDGGAGLIRAVWDGETPVEIAWRRTAEAALVLALGGPHWRVVYRALSVGNDVDSPIADMSAPVDVGPDADVQIIDDGGQIGVYVDDVMVFGGWLSERRNADAPMVTIEPASDAGVRRAEVFPRVVPVPDRLAPATRIPVVEGAWGRPIVDEFTGPADDLDGRPHGTARWSRTIGTGHFETTGAGGLRFVATASEPLPGRTAYTVPVEPPGATRVELEIDVVAPGTDRGAGERGRAGLLFEQDGGNALIVNTWLDDGYDGTSVSSFFRLGGYEDLYDAVWTNVGRRISWGQPYRLRAAFDGLLYQVWVDDELVLYRSLTDIHPGQPRLAIRRVGIVGNWEWGTDTGSLIRRWQVRAAA